VLRCSQFANVQAFDEDDVKDGQKVSKRKNGFLRRDGAAVSPDNEVEDVDLRVTLFEALLSCPHANPKFISETQIPGTESALWLWKGLSQSLVA
jgi:hypothetical protein